MMGTIKSFSCLAVSFVSAVVINANAGSVGGLTHGLGIGKSVVFWNDSPTARDYASKGLIAMWDGIENVGFGSHDSTSATWHDLGGGGFSFDVAGCTWDEKSIQIPNNVSIRAYLPEVVRDAMTLECIVERESRERIILWIKNPTWNGGVLFGFSSNIFYFPWSELHIPVATENDVVKYVMTFKQNDQALYIDNVMCDSKAVALAQSSNRVLSIITLGEYAGSGKRGRLEILAVRLYDRVLSRDELDRNHKVDMKRFGIR